MGKEINTSVDIPSPIRWIDSHCHLTDERFAPDLDAVIARAAAAGVERIVIVGDSIAASRTAVGLTGRAPGLYALAGVHPHNAKDWSDAAGEELREICRSSSVIVAVGEIGLDYYYDFSPREAQVTAFLAQAEIARELRLPIAIHCRDAYDLMLEIVRSHDLATIGGVVHCFSGTAAQAVSFVDLGFRLGIAGPLTFKKNAMNLEVVRAVPLEALVLETDSPYLSPIPMRGKRNEPAFLVHTGVALAAAVGQGIETVARVTTANTIDLYHLDTLH